MSAYRIRGLRPPAEGASLIVVTAVARRRDAALAALEARLAAGRAHLEAGRLLTAQLTVEEPAPPLLELAEALSSGAGGAWFERRRVAGLARESVGVPADAVAWVAHLASRVPADADPLPCEVRRSLRAGDLDRAVVLLRVWHALFPGDEAVAAQLAESGRALAESLVARLIGGVDPAAAVAVARDLERLPPVVFGGVDSRVKAAEVLAAARLEHWEALVAGAAADPEAAGELALELEAGVPAGVPEASASAARSIVAGASAELERACEARRAEADAAFLEAEAASGALVLRTDAELEVVRDRGGAVVAAELAGRRAVASRRAGRRVVVAMAAAAAVVAVVLGALEWRAERVRREAAAAEARRLQAEREAEAARPPPPPELVGELQGRLRELAVVLGGERTSAQATRVRTELAELSALVGGVPETYRGELEARLAAQRAAFEAWRVQFQREFEEVLRLATETASPLAPAGTAEAVAAALRRAEPLVAEATTLAALPAVEAGPEPRATLAALRRVVTEAKAALDRWEAARTALAGARDLAAWRAAVAAVAAVPLPGEPAVVAAAAWVAEPVEGGDLAVQAHFPAEPVVAEYLRRAASLDFAGGEATGAGLTALLGEPALQDIHQYLFVRVTDEGRGQPVVVHTAGPVTTEEYRTGEDRRVRQVARVLAEGGVVAREFVSVIRPDGSRRGETLDFGYRTPEATLRDSVARASPPGGIPLLAVMEGVVREATVAPLLRAYYLDRLGAVLEGDAVALGLRFSPSAVEDLVVVRRLAEGDLTPTAWVAPGRAGVNAQLAAFLREAAEVSYLREARFVASVERVLATATFRFAGVVDAAGRMPEVRGAGEAPGLLWALCGPRRRLARVGPGREPPLPLSPVWVEAVELPAVVEAAARQAGLTGAERARLAPLLEKWAELAR